MAFDSERKVRETKPPVKRLIDKEIAHPSARTRNWNISEVYMNPMGPRPMEKNDTKARLDTTHRTTAHGDGGETHSKAEERYDHPAGAAQQQGTPVDTIEQERGDENGEQLDHADGACRPQEAVVVGVYKTTESIPEWLNPMEEIEEDRREKYAPYGGGRGKTSSFQTRFFSPWSLPGTGTTSPSRSTGIPAAALMSARRSVTSSDVSEVLSKTALASARRPFMTSHRGDSGMPNTMSATRMDGAALMPSMMR
nr:unnamed protein product [Digitaria exilis]